MKERPKDNTYSQLVLAVGKLAKIAVETCSLFLEVAANLGLESRVGGARSLACDGRVELKAGVVGLRVEERGVGVDGVSHGELLRGMKLLPDHQIRHLLTTSVQIPEGRVRIEVEVVIEVLPHGIDALESTWSGVEALGHDAGSGGGGASLGAGPTEAREDIFGFVDFKHIHGKEWEFSTFCC